MQLSILGSEPAWASGPRPSSGYLLRTNDATLLLDCGTSVFGRLREEIAPEELTAILISHLHFDHWSDLVPLRYYLWLEARSGRPVPLYLPPGGTDALRRIMAPVDGDPEFFTGTFAVREYDPHETLCIGALACTFARTKHPIETYAIRIDGAEVSLTYSADTSWHPPLARFAEGSNAFLCEATEGVAATGSDYHLSAAEAGRLAKEGRVGRLLLTHIAQDAAMEAVEAARGEYDGPISHAQVGLSFQLV